MKNLILGAAGFIGTNLVRKLLTEGTADDFLLYDRLDADYRGLEGINTKKIEFCSGEFSMSEDFDSLTRGVSTLYHLISTTIPGNSNVMISKGIEDNVVVTAKLLDSCIKNGVSKVVFLSSGGTVYGVENSIPICEETEMNPISAYGMQKIAIEKLLYLYHYMYGIDYRIIRLANPYGPYQKPNGIQGVVATFVYQALNNEELRVYGDGSVTRDYIYIDDAIEAILNIVQYEGPHKIFNLGTEKGYSINEIIEHIAIVLERKLKVVYLQGRKVDVPVNVLNMSRYKNCIGGIHNRNIEDGLRLTVQYMRSMLQ